MKPELLAKLHNAGLSRIAEELLSISKPSIRFVTTSADDQDISVGRSKVGGFPDLPLEVSIPQWKDKPLAFLAQINLEDIRDFGAAADLPPSGILSFFYTASQETWGFDPKDLGSWRVFFFEDVIDLHRVVGSNDELREGCYQPCTISFFEDLTLPDWSSMLVEALGLTEEEKTAYLNLADHMVTVDSNQLMNRILGYPDQIQFGDMQVECQMASNGIYYGDAKSHLHPRYKELEPGSFEWQLIFQLDSDDNAQMMWGDVGRLYFWLRKKALVKRDFQESWMILQCA